jgi:small-conductance mechanosensitive channel
MEQFSYEQIWRSALILAAGLGLFFGLRGRLWTFADHAGLPRLAYNPVRLIIRYGILIITIALTLQTLGFPVQTIFAGLAAVLGLIAIGFVAVWSILSNILCTFVLIGFKPFAVGDDLEFPAENISGKVVDLTLIYTTLQTSDGAYVQIPNNMFFQRIFKRRPGEQVMPLEEQLRQPPPAA